MGAHARILGRSNLSGDEPWWLDGGGSHLFRAETEGIHGTQHLGLLRCRGGAGARPHAAAQRSRLRNHRYGASPEAPTRATRAIGPGVGIVSTGLAERVLSAIADELAL